MKIIETREDVSILVDTFYAKIRKDELLGNIFNSHIPEDKWGEHLQKLTDFWETNLFGIPKFKGNPSQKHIDVDRNLEHSIEKNHFDHWLELWFETVDELYNGLRAERAKDAAQRMAFAQFMVVLNHRPK
ncbi:MAG: group III truncated hemoglobin [Saprospiraceae bacterium]